MKPKEGRTQEGLDPMRILYVAPRPPYPPEGRETVRPYHHLRFLALKHNVDLICFSGGGVDEWKARERLKKLCHRVQLIPIDTPPQDPAKVSNLFRRRPLALRRYYRKNLLRRLTGIGESARYDLVFFYSAAMAPYLAAFPDTPRVVDLVDVGSLRWMEYSNLSRFPGSAIYRAEASRLLSVEKRAAEIAQRVLFASENEAEVFRGLCPGNDRIVSLKTPANPRAPLLGPRAADPTILLPGHLDHFPNSDAAVWFLAEVFPRVKRKIETARVVLAGKNPPGEIRSLAERPDVEIASPRTDLRLLFREAWLAAAPHRVARGVRNEVLEALGAGLPVVASKAAVTGLDLLRGRDLVVTTGAEEMAEAIAGHLRDPSRLEALGQTGRKAVQNNYSHWSIALRLEEILNAASVETVVYP